MGNACATSEDNRNESVSFRETQREASNGQPDQRAAASGNDFPTGDIATAQEQMNPVGLQAQGAWTAGGAFLLRDDPATESYPTGGPYKYADGTTY